MCILYVGETFAEWGRMCLLIVRKVVRYNRIFYIKLSAHISFPNKSTISAYSLFRLDADAVSFVASVPMFHLTIFGAIPNRLATRTAFELIIGGIFSFSFQAGGTYLFQQTLHCLTQFDCTIPLCSFPAPKNYAGTIKTN